MQQKKLQWFLRPLSSISWFLCSQILPPLIWPEEHPSLLLKQSPSTNLAFILRQAAQSYLCNRLPCLKIDSKYQCSDTQPAKSPGIRTRRLWLYGPFLKYYSLHEEVFSYQQASALFRKDMFLCKKWHLKEKENLTATEFFISATAEVNSLKWSSGQYTRGWTKSPQFRPALTQAFSHSSLLVRTAAWYFPVAIPWWDIRQKSGRIHLKCAG